MDVGLVGCGNIGKIIAHSICKGEIDASLIAITDKHKKKAKKLKSELKCTPKINEIDSLVKKSELVIEAASIKAVEEVAKKALQNNCEVMLMSVGALADENLKKEIEKLARKNDLNIYLPSGAICGLDGIKSASSAKLNEVKITTKKPTESLEGAPGAKGIKKIKKQKTIFEGNAKEAIELFPKNVNVSTALSLAGIGTQKTKVEIIANPNLEENIHEISAKGEFGELKTVVKNIPSPQNPKTSYLAALSAISTLKKIISPIKVGT
ncbi:aspartate dehydrogenase [archaeon SCG-AAA382B04]|nr:aspartate dehydrogenase [archaeon SCG-AAA382B04]